MLEANLQWIIIPAKEARTRWGGISGNTPSHLMRWKLERSTSLVATRVEHRLGFYILKLAFIALYMETSHQRKNYCGHTLLYYYPESQLVFWIPLRYQCTPNDHHSSVPLFGRTVDTNPTKVYMWPLIRKHVLSNIPIWAKRCLKLGTINVRHKRNKMTPSMVLP